MQTTHQPAYFNSACTHRVILTICTIYNWIVSEWISLSISGSCFKQFLDIRFQLNIYYLAGYPPANRIVIISEAEITKSKFIKILKGDKI